MKRSTKKLFAVILSLAMILTSISTDFITAKAEDYSQYFTFESYQKSNPGELDGYNAIRETAGTYEAEIGGVKYTNYALSSSAGGTATATAGPIDCKGIIDGNSGGGYQVTTSNDVQSMIVDLNRVRSISILQLSWETASAQIYAIDFSMDGQSWTTVAYMDSCLKTGSRCDQINLVTAQNTRYIRVQFLKRQTGYNYNLYEISAFCASGRADGADPIAAYTYTKEQQSAINNSSKEIESRYEYESESKAAWDAYMTSLAKYVNTDTNIAKGAKVYPSSYYNGEGNPEYLTDGNLSKFATTAKLSADNKTEFFIIDLGKEYKAADIDKIFINYVANDGTWGRDGFKLYASDSTNFTTKLNDKNLQVVDVDSTQWNLLYNESSVNNCTLQNYYQQFSSSYAGNFRYLKLEYTYISNVRTWGVQINEFALYAPVEEESTTKEIITEIPTEPETLRPVTETAFVEENPIVTNVKYQYKYAEAGYAAGTISLTTKEDQRYSLYWGTGDDTQGYKALTKNNVPYTALGKVTTSSNTGTFTVISDYTAIPAGATKLLVLDEQNDIQYVYGIPENRVFVENGYTYTFASVGDQHYNRYTASGKDDALFAFDNALKFIDSQGIKFVAGIGDLSSLGEKTAFTKFREAVNDYPNLTVLSCIGNHDAVDKGPEYFKQYINEDIYKYKNEDSATLESRGILGIGSNEMDFAYSPKGTDDVFVFLNMNCGKTNAYTNTSDILTSTQLDWLDAQLKKYTNRNVYLYFHVYLSTDSLSTSLCVGNLKNPGGYSYNLTYSTAASDGERLRSIINKYDNVTMFSGHSHWLYSMQIFNPNLNIGTTSTVPFAKGATIVHVSSVTEPRYVGINDSGRTELNNQASEGTFTDVYSDCNIYTGVDFWNRQYEAYATYIVPKGEMKQPEPEKETPTSEKETPTSEKETSTSEKETTTSEKETSGKVQPEEAVGLAVSSNHFNEISISFSNPTTENGADQLYNIYIGSQLVDENVHAGTYIYANQIEGTHTVKVVAILNGICSSGVTKTVDVTAESGELPQIEIEGADIQIEGTQDYTYTGTEIKPNVTVSIDGKTLIKDKDYTVSYENNKNAGQAFIKITGKNLYIGTAEQEFTINPKDLTDSDITVNDSNLKNQFEFIGKDRTPIVELKYNGQSLNVMIDFTVKYDDNFWPGTAKVTMKGTRNFTGEIIKNFTIVKKSIGNVTIRTSFDSNKQLVITVNNGSYSMIKDKDYSYKVVTDEKGNITITFTGLGNNYTGIFVKKIDAEDNPNKPAETTTQTPIKVKTVSVKKVANTKGKKVKVTWKKVSKVTGYNVRYSTDKKFKKSKTKTKTVKKNTATYTIKKLALKKKYYIQIRAYKVYKNKIYYGNWSKSKKIKITK